MVSFWGNPI